MLRKALITAAVVLAALISNGTAPVSANDPKPHQNPNACPPVVSDSVAGEQPGEGEQELREDFHQTYPLSEIGRVILENLNGGVQIRVWDRPAVQVDAVKRAYRRERLAEARIEVNSSEGLIRIKTEYPDGNQTFHGDRRRYDNPAIVDYSLTVPRKAILESIELVNGSIDIEGSEGSVKASSINGRVIARGLQGEARLSTINGSLQATFLKLIESSSISLTSVNGNLTLVIPSDSNAAVRANTVHGGISNDFGLPVRHGQYVGHDLSGQIGTGGPRIKLENVNGSIRITHQQDGRRVSPARSLIEAQVREDVEPANAAEIAEAREAIREAAREIKEANREAAREVREALRESQRRDVVLREAQREVARAQVEVQREITRQAREEIRIKRGSGMGVGVGVGYGGRYVSQESKSFPVTGSPQINVGTFDGSITVHGWDKPEVMYTVTKRAEEDAYLKHIVVKAEQQGSSISIIANSDEHVGSAQLDVYVPRRASLHVSSGDGGLTLNGVSGQITLRTGEGAIEVQDASGQLHVNTGDGQISVRNFEGQVEARTGDGAIALDGIFNAVIARTGEGAISLAVPPGSNFTVETNASDTVVNEGLLLTEDITPTQRVRRWRIGNGGQVFVLNTGDGRIVVRSR